MINPFSINVPLLYPLKTSENLRFSDVFRGYRSRTLFENGLNYNKNCKPKWRFRTPSKNWSSLNIQKLGRGIFRTLTNICFRGFFVKRVIAAHYFWKKTPLRMFGRALNTILLGTIFLPLPIIRSWLHLLKFVQWSGILCSIDLKIRKMFTEI